MNMVVGEVEPLKIVKTIEHCNLNHLQVVITQIQLLQTEPEAKSKVMKNLLLREGSNRKKK